MKKTHVIMAAAAAAMAISLASCASTSAAVRVTDKGISLDLSTPNAKNDEADKVVVVDWTDRTLGEDSAPKWLRDLTRGNADTFKEDWTSVSPDRVVKFSRATGRTEAQAQALSRAGFAYTQAAELNQKVIGRVGQGLNDMGQLEALYLAASETKAEMSGLREEASFWQKVRTTNADTGAKSEQFIYYTIYSMSKETWESICRKYLMDLMGDANLETATQQKIGALFSEMVADADKKDAKKQAEEDRLYEEQMARLEAERAKANAETARAGLKAKTMDAKEAETKRAVEQASRLASFLK